MVKFCNSLIRSLTVASCCKLLPSPVNDIPLYVNSYQRSPCSLRVQNVVESLKMVTLGAFHSTKIPVRNFGNSTCLTGRYIPAAQSRPKPPRVWLLFLWAGYKRAVLGTTFCQMERVISVRPTEMTRPVKVDHLQSWSRTFRSDQTEMIRSIWCTNRIFRNFGLNGKRPLFILFW